MSQHTRSSIIHKQVGWLFLQVTELSLSSYLWLCWVQLKLILEGRLLVVCVSSGLISSSPSAVLLCHLHKVWKAFTPQFVSRFNRTYGTIRLLSPLDIFCLSPFESLANDRDSLFVFIAFASFSFSKSLSLSLHPTRVIDPNHFRETREQLVTFFQ